MIEPWPPNNVGRGDSAPRFSFVRLFFIVPFLYCGQALPVAAPQLWR